MMINGIRSTSNIRIVGCDDGEVFPLFGDGAGTGGVCLKQSGIEEIYEAPIKVVESTTVRMDGGVLRAVKTAVLEPVITVFVKGDHVNSFGTVDSNFRKAFSHELDPYYEDSRLARIEWETDETTRWIEVVLGEGTSWSAEQITVPQLAGWYQVELHLKAYDPFWIEDDEITPIEFATNESKTVEISNPTGVDMGPKWVGTPAQYTIPDNTWSGRQDEREPGGLYPTRTVQYPNVTAVDNGGIVIDLDSMQLPVRDAFNTNLIGLMPVPGNYPRFKIPRFTQPQELTVSATHVPVGGAVLTLRQPRKFRRPWGGV